MEDEQGLNLFEDQDVTEFVAQAAEYCTFLENTNNFTKTDFVKKAISLLSGLYFYSLKLPRIEDTEVLTPEKYVTELEWTDIYDKVKTRLGYHDDYLDVYDPVSKEEGDLSIASLADNFADIYQDLKNFTTDYGFGNEEVMAGALWEIIYNFEEFWGIKLLNALRALHRIFYSDEDLEDEEQPGSLDEEERSNWLFDEKRKQSKNKGE